MVVNLSAFRSGKYARNGLEIDPEEVIGVLRRWVRGLVYDELCFLPGVLIAYI